ncbi:aminoacyl tRNA synthase complex-interacting multifunctional protein 2-like [Dendronephthya gigantea]|uniref:aminoacyl tRNA synthase complex-interacting multifunctional protein 2-like n=1 Tax=Dendronephthya gigantea TaxID=151771 RepID=UPI00106ACD2E|nr:aminoacyl tRNA synthase complex-interacting multifunctional protein 2-like [Dendronephthya gigantea]
MSASGMYKIKPIYDNSDLVIELPTCMYKMKNIHEDSSDDTAIDNPELLELISHQETVLKELEKLKLEIDQIGEDIGLSSKTKPAAKATSAKEPPTTPAPISCNMVVKTSPKDPPFSVYLLYQLALKHGLDCSTMSHTHSSLPGQVPDNIQKLFDNSCCRNSDICLRFIWRSDILAPNLMISIANQSPILGESNILRFLARQFLPDLYNAHSPLQIATIDDWLSSAIQFTSTKDGETFIQNLNTHLGKHNWLSGDAISIADIYCSVALIKSNSNRKLPKNVSKWMANCRKELPSFDQVENLCK